MAEDGVVAEFARLLVNTNISSSSSYKSIRSTSGADYDKLQHNELEQQEVQEVESATPAARRACTIVLAELARYAFDQLWHYR
jgi:hypothetical protein